MNVKELLFIVGFAMLSTWAIEYFFLNKYRTAAPAEGVRSGQQFTAPTQVQELRPLNTEVEFACDEKPLEPQITTIETEHARLHFSTAGASLAQLEFKRERNGQPTLLSTVSPIDATQREKSCFLVALNDQTPFNYTLASQQDHPDRIELTYQAETAAGTVTKTYTVYKANHRIDLNIAVTPKTAQAPVQARLFWPAPFIPAIVTTDMYAALVSTEKDSITSIRRASIDTNAGWFAPTFFGSEDNYCVFALIGDEQHFAQRAYFNIVGQHELFSIVEGPAMIEPQSWTLSFYFGPKERLAMMAVDPQLTQAMAYSSGFFGTILGPIATLLVWLLKLLYSYIGNYGWAIIALTILMKLILLPFSFKSGQSMKKQTEVQQKLKHLQIKFKDDPERLARERLELMKKDGMPGMAGCLPLLLQIPVFFALNRVLSTSYELYDAPFVPWIQNLSQPDPYYVLPALILIVMLMQAAVADPKQRMMFLAPALIFGAFSSYLAAGLCLYIFVSTLLGVSQTMIQKKLKMA